MTSVLNYSSQKRNFESLKRARDEDDFEESAKRYKNYHQEIIENDLIIDEEYLVNVFTNTLKIKIDKKSLQECLSGLKINDESEQDEHENIYDDLLDIIEFEEEEPEEEEQEAEEKDDKEHDEQKEKILQIELMNLDNF
jgi:hypothetical protein